MGGYSPKAHIVAFAVVINGLIRPPWVVVFLGERGSYCVALGLVGAAKGYSVRAQCGVFGTVVLYGPLFPEEESFFCGEN